MPDRVEEYLFIFERDCPACVLPLKQHRYVGGNIRPASILLEDCSQCCDFAVGLTARKFFRLAFGLQCSYVIRANIGDEPVAKVERLSFRIYCE